MENNELKDKIHQLIQKKGKITFAEFMDMALYYPKLGYYQKENPFGEHGSFYTSVNASSSFGRSVALGFLQVFQSTEIDYNICEMGAGSGMLAKDILDFYQFEAPLVYEEIKYIIIEKSNYLIERQKEILAYHLENGKISWLDFNEFKNFNGIYFSNELVDAFPVHRIINIEGEYKELFVIEHNGKFEFYPDTFSTDKLQEYINNMEIKLDDKQIADINLHATDWIEKLGKKIDKGFVFTIDYGFEAKQLFSSFRMDGTVTCYFKHTQNNDFFERIGFQDITAFVDFSALKFYGKKNNLDTVSFIPQWLFLIQSGILQEIEEAETDLQRSSIRSLIIPEGGFGTNFHVLIQSKNIEIQEDFIYKKSSFETFDMLSKIF